MVKINRTLKKELKSTIKINIKRFISLVSIIFLGVCFYVGMKSNSPVLENTMATYFENLNYMDIQIASVIGLSEDELKTIKKRVPEIKLIEGGYEQDVMIDLSDDVAKVVAVHSYNPDKKLNKAKILSGRMPISIDECAVDGSMAARDGYKLGDIITLNEDTFKEKEVIIVGLVRSPSYISIEYGYSATYAKKINYFMYVSEENFVHDEGIYSRGYISLDTKYRAFTEEYDELVASVKKRIEKVSPVISKERYDEAIKEGTKKLEDAEAEYNDAKSQADGELANAKAQLEDAEKQIASAESNIMSDIEVDLYLANVKTQLDMAKTQLDSTHEILMYMKELLNNISSSSGYSGNIDLGYLKEKLDDSNNSLNNLNNTLKDLKIALQENKDKCNLLEDEGLIETCNNTSKSIELQIETTNKKITNTQEEINQLIKLISLTESLSNVDLKAYLNEMEAKYNSGMQEYNSGLKQYNYAVKNMKSQMQNAKVTIEQKKVELATAKLEYEKQEKEVRGKLSDAYRKLEDGKRLLKELKDSSWYILTRSDNSSYSQYLDDVSRIDNLSKILPYVFFLVAALVTSSSISRMINEERQKIGIFKVLGYSDKQVTYKYLYYSGAAAAIGIVLGISIGLVLFPKIFSTVYSLLYFLPDVKYIFNIKSVVLSVIFALCSTVLVAYFSTKDTAKEYPCYLMKQKSEKLKKLTILEKNKKIWKKLPFLIKISYRNVFRYMRKSAMTILGISGCTALVLASFGTRDSITDIIFRQYGKIFNVSAEMFYKNGYTYEELKEEQARIDNMKDSEKTALGRMEIVNVKNKKDNKTFDVYCVVPDNMTELEKTIHLYDEEKKKSLSLTEDGVILTRKIANLMDVKVGDNITFSISEDEEYTVKITGLTENYIYHYMYLSKKQYVTLTGKDFLPNLLLVKFNDEISESDMVDAVYESNMYSNSLLMSNAESSYKEVIGKFNDVLVVIIISAGLLAFVVLYNLAKINISERIREIATLKVLGFNKKEISDYINNEMRFLTIVGIILGLFVGRFLTEMITTACELDTVMFVHKVNIYSYVYAVVLTIVFSMIVRFVVKKDLNKIDMVESLKSSE